MPLALAGRAGGARRDDVGVGELPAPDLLLLAASACSRLPRALGARRHAA